MRRLAFLSALVVLALLIDFRVRVAAAGVLMLMLGLGKKYGVLESLPVPGFLTYLGRISYSVFLVHFPLCLVVNAIFSHYFPHRALINAFGVVIAFGVSIVGGALFFKWIEGRHFRNRIGWLLPAGFFATGLLAALQSS
jgi:peptidoglycan/LPS O-acetylase OafA/YrhL